MNKNRNLLWRSISVAVLAGACGVAAADTHPALDRISISLGAYQADSDADARVNGSAGVLGSNVNFEDDFGLTKDREVARARLSFLIGESQGLEIDGYSFNRSATKTLDRTIVYDGSTFDVDAQVHGKLDMDFASVAWRWWIPAGDAVIARAETDAPHVGVAGEIAGTATLNGDEQFVRTDESASAWAPLVELGWRHAFSDRARLYADISGVYKSSGSISGHIYNGALGFEYFPWQAIGFGVEYGAQRIKIDADKSNFNGELNIRLSGPSAFLKARF